MPSPCQGQPALTGSGSTGRISETMLQATETQINSREGRVCFRLKREGTMQDDGVDRHYIRVAPRARLANLEPRHTFTDNIETSSCQVIQDLLAIFGSHHEPPGKGSYWAQGTRLPL